MKLPNESHEVSQRFTLQHGKGTQGPFLDELVPTVKTHKIPKWATVSGYGSKIPTQYMVYWCDKWRRVYCDSYGNGASSGYIIDHKNNSNIYCI